MKIKLRFLLLIIAVSLNFTSSAQTIVPGGPVSGTWTLADSPYQIEDSISIPDDSALTIMPGVTVNFEGNYQLRVLGRLLAIGTMADTIVFTAADTSVGWQGIRFPGTSSANDTSKIMFCKLEYGKASDTLALGYGGALCFNYFSKAIVSNCLITNCYANAYGGAIYCFNSSPVIAYNTIVNNTSKDDGSAIECDSISNASITNNVISFNTAQFGAGTVSCNGSSPFISNNIISYNVAGGGGGIACTAANAFIADNIISNNTTSTGNGGGIVCESGSPFISNNTITNNTAHDAGGGMFFVDSTASVILNNTIANNQANKGGAIYCLLSSPSLRNCILWGNTAVSGPQVCFLDSASQPGFYYCDVQGDSSAFGFTLAGGHYSGIYSNNLDTDPLFASPSGGSGTSFNGATADWSLQSNSPCIDKGDPAYNSYPATDLAGNPRVNACIIDIGAYEYQQSYIFPTPVITIVHNDTLYCSTDSLYISYQWYDDTTIIAGATDTVFVISHGGNYNVKVTSAKGCTIAVGINIVTGINPVSSNDGISFFPDPATSQLTVHISTGHANNTVMAAILNMLGQEISPPTRLAPAPSAGTEDAAIYISDLAPGIYFLLLKWENGSAVKKFVKE